MDTFTKWGADPDLDLTILSLSPKPGAGTIALASVIREAAFLHIPSSVVYGSLILVTASFSNNERVVLVVGLSRRPTVMSWPVDELGPLKLKISALLLVLAAVDIAVAVVDSSEPVM